MTFSNNPNLRRYLMDGGLAHLAVFASFEFPAETFDGRLIQVRTQHPYLDEDEAAARAAYRMLAAQGKRHKPTAKIKKRLGIRFWIIVAAIVISGLLAGYFCAAHAEPNAQQMQVIRNAMRGVSLLAAPQANSGIIVQFRNGGSTLATRPAGLLIFDCGTNMSCSFSGSTFTLTSSATGSTAWSAITGGTNAGQSLLVGNGSSFAPTGSGTITSTAFTPAGTLNNCVKWGSGGTLADAGAVCGGAGSPSFTSLTTGSNTTATMTVGTGGTLTFSGTGVLNADRINGVEFTNAESLGKIPIGQGDGTAVWADPLVQGLTTHDAAGSTTNPVAIGGFASASAPTDVSTDVDIVRGWFLRNGAQATALTAAGALIGGDAANGLDVDVTRSALPTGASTSANQTTEIAALQLIDNLPVAQGSTTSGQSGVLIQGAVTTAAPSYTNAQTSPLSLTTAGELRVAGTFNAGIIQVSDNTGVAQNVGYFAGDLNVPVQSVEGGLTGAAVPTSAMMVGGSDGTNLRSLSVTTGGVLNVGDGSGAFNVICDSGCSGGTQYAEDTATASDELLTMAGVVRDDTPASLVGADLDRTVLQVDGTGRLWVNGSGVTQPVSGTVTVTDGAGALNVIVDSGSITANAGTNLNTSALSLEATQADVRTSVQLIDDTIFTDDSSTHSTGTTKGVGIMATATPTDTAVNANDIGMLAMSVNRELLTSTAITSIAAGDNNIGNVDIVTLPSVTIGTFPDNEPINVAQMNGVAVTMNNGAAGTGVQRVTLASDSTGNIATIGTSVTPGTAAGNLGKLEDANSASGDTLVAIAAQRDDYPPATTTNATTDYEVPHTDNNGALYVRKGGTGTGTAGPWVGYVNCDNTAIYSASTNGNTELVALTTNETIVVCGFQISQSTSTAVSVRLVYGTGSACATGETSMTPTYPIQAAASTGPIGMVVMTPGFMGMKTAVSNALCIETNAAVSVQAMVWYAKFDETP